MSSKLNNQNIMPRYSVIAIVMTLLAVAIVVKTVYIMTAKRQYWTAVAARLKVDSVQVKPTRWRPDPPMPTRMPDA